MIRHIFRKDLLLLWPLVALCTLAQFALDAMMFVTDSSDDTQYLLLTARLFSIVVLLVIAFTIALVVQQEPIPGTRQDWLIRPIRRLDLLLAKALFILAAVHLPMFIGDLVESLAHGFDVGQAARAALSRNLYVMMSISVPAFGIAAMTRNMTQYVVVGVLYFFTLAAASFLLSALARIGGDEQATNPLFWTGVNWIPQTFTRLALAAGALVALALLYSHRRIAAARIGFAGFAIAGAFASLLPWGLIFGVETAVAGTPSDAASFGLAIDPKAPRYTSKPGENIDDYALGAAQVQLRGRQSGDIQVENETRQTQGDRTVFIPVRITGMPGGMLPWADRAEVTLRSADGKVLFHGRGDDLKLAAPGLAYEAIRIPALIFEAAKDQSINIDIAYSLSLLRARSTVSAPALGADMVLPGVGHCTTGRDEDGDDIALRCVRPGKPPTCVSVTLADPATGRRNPDTQLCSPDYSPYAGRLLPDAISRFEVETAFRDRLGLARYPVSGADLAHARVMLTTYSASGHLQRHVAISGLKLTDWTAVSVQAPAPRS